MEIALYLRPKVLHRHPTGNLIDVKNVVRLVCQASLTKLNEKIKPYQLTNLFALMLHYRIFEPMYFEILSIEFVRNFDAFDLDQKTMIYNSIASCDMDATSIIKSAHAMIASVFEAYHIYQDTNLIQIEGE